MSAASSCTVGSSFSDLMTDTAAGPPTPVTSTRIFLWLRSSRDIWYPPDTFHGLLWCWLWCLIWYLIIGPGPGAPIRRGGPGTVLAAHHALRRSQLVLPGHRRLPDHLERLGVAPFAVAGPVARGRLDQVGLQIGPDLHLGSERVDGLELAVHLLVDGDETGGPEVHGGRRRLEAVDPAHLANGDQRRLVRVPVILVHIVQGVGVDHGRPHGRDDAGDHADRRVPLPDAGVLQVLVVERGADNLRCLPGLTGPGVLGAAAGAAAQGQDRHLVAQPPVHSQRAGRPDLDVVRVSPNGTQALPGGRAVGRQ